MPISTKKLSADTDELIRRALLMRPDLAARVEELKASKESTKRAVADFLPVIKLEGQYINASLNYNATQGNSNSYFSGGGMSGCSRFLTMHWDLFDGFDRSSRLQRRQEEDKVAAQNVKQTELNTTRDVWVAYNDSQAAGERVRSAEAFVASAKESFDAIRAAEGTGLTNITDYYESGSNLNIARSELAAAVAGYSTALAALALAVGEGAGKG